MADVDKATETQIANLKAQTGKTLEEWTALLAPKLPLKHGEIVSLLKAKHGVGHGYANLIAHKALKSDAGSADGGDLIASQFAGPKTAMRPVYDAVIAAIQGFGNDVEIAPKKAYVSFRRSKQFGLAQPSTKERLDVGLVLKGVTPSGRLEASGSFNAMVTHRVRLGSAKEVDRELIAWLRKAYEEA